MKLFSVDGGLYKFMDNLLSVFKLNMLWLICSLPIITSGAATIAAFDVAMRMVDEEEGYISKQFFKAFKANLKRGIPMGLLGLVCIYIVWLDFALFMQLEDPSIMLVIMGIIAAFVFTLGFLYAFPLQARYENTILRTLENSFNISLKFYARTIFLVVILVIELMIIFWNLTTIFIGVLIGPACIVYTISGAAKPIFRELEREPGAVSNPDEK